MAGENFLARAARVEDFEGGDCEGLDRILGGSLDSGMDLYAAFGGAGDCRLGCWRGGQLRRV